MKVQDRLVVALDGFNSEQALAVVKELKGVASTFKVGLALFSEQGPEIVDKIQALGAQVFLDLKFHDIPMQVGQAVKAAGKLGPRFLTVHASGGRNMLGMAKANCPAGTELLAVSLLTSLEERDMGELGFASSLIDTFLNFAKLSYAQGITSFVASPLEVRLLKSEVAEEALVICPGIRGAGMPCQDQRRTLSAREAIDEGADILVVGRPITEAPDRVLAAQSILEEIDAALTRRSTKEQACEAR